MLSLRHLLASAIVAVAACLPLAGLTGCTAPQQVSQPLPDLQKSGLKEIWQHRLQLLPGERIVNVWRVGDSIYVTTSEAHVMRLTANEGTLKWQVDLGDKQYPIFRPSDTPAGKSVLVVNRGKGFLVDKQTGNIILQNALTIAVTTDPIVAGNTFCVGGAESYRALYLDVLGGQKWSTPSPNDVFTARPAIEGDTILLSSEHGKLWRINGLNGEWMWRDRKTNGRVVAPLAVDGRAVYVPCLDNNLYAFELTSGAFLWNKPLEGRLDRPISVTRSEVLVPSTGKGLYALNNTRGDIKWVVPGITDVGTIVRDRVWVSDAGGNIEALSLETGEVLSTSPASARLVTNNVDQLVIAVNKEGTLAAYSTSK